VSASVTFGASVIGGAVAAVAALGGVAIGQRGENARATRADKQGLRDAKSGRLRRLYEPFMEFAMLLQQVASEKGYVREGETVEKRDERHQSQLADGMHQVSGVIAATVIEPGTADVRKFYEATYRSCDTYLRSLNMNARFSATTSVDKLNEQFKAISQSAESLEASILRQLEELETPI
jgi:hypothetical protein